MEAKNPSLPMRNLTVILILYFFLPFYSFAQYGFEWVMPPKYESYISTESKTYLIFVKNNKIGVFDTLGKQILPYKYDAGNGITIWDDYALVSDSDIGLQGVINLKTGKIEVPFEYQYCYRLYDFFNRNMPLYVNKDGKFGLLEFGTWKTILPVEFQQINMDVDKQVITASKNNLWGLYDLEGKKILAHEYHTINVVNANEYLACKKLPGMMAASYFQYDAENPENSKWMPTKMPTHKWGLINKSGKTLIPFRYLYLNTLADDAYSATIEGKIDTSLYLIESLKMSVIDKNGKELLPSAKMNTYPIYQSPYFTVEKDTLYAIFDSTAKQLCPFQYTSLWNNSDNLTFTAQRDGKFGYLDKTGKELFPFKFESVGDIVNGRSFAEKDGKFGFIDLKGNWLFPPVYTSISRIDSLFGYVSSEINDAGTGLFGVVDLKTGKQIIPTECSYYYEEESPGFIDGLLRCCDPNGKERLYNTQGKAISFNRFQCNYSQLSNGVLAVLQDGKGYGYIDTNGKTVIPCIFEEVTTFVGKIATVKKDGKYGIIRLK
jgi:WG containing repeat